MNAFVNGLTLFKIGWSWGGTTSLVMSYPSYETKPLNDGHIVRFSIGLEDPEDLVADLRQAIEEHLPNARIDG